MASWWRGMMCGAGVRLSKQFLEEVKRISEKNGVLYFIEIMIPSFAHGGGSLTHKCIPELDNIVYRATYDPSSIRSDCLYHPIKGYGLQNKFRDDVQKLMN